MLASLGDNCFGSRVYYDKNRNVTHIDVYISNGSKWDQLTGAELGGDWTDKWHDIVISYDGSKLYLYVDGEAAGEKECITVSSIKDSGAAFSIGFDPQKNRRSEISFASVKVFGEAMDASAAASAAAEDAVYWLDLNESAPEKEADKRLLSLAVTYALAAKEDASYVNVNGIVKARFEAALENAQRVLADETADQAAVNAAWVELSNAIHMLGFTSDKAALAELTEQAAAIIENIDQYQGDTDALQAAYEHALEILDSDTALDESIQAALEALQAAMNGVEKKPEAELDTSVLELLVSVSLEVNLEDYIEAGQAEFTSALDEAQAVLADPQSQEQIDAARDTLHDAYLSLRLKASEELLKSLADFVAAARSIDRSLYTADALALIDEAADRVEAALEAHKAKAPELDQDSAAELAAYTESVLSVINTPSAPQITPVIKTDLLAAIDQAAGMNKDLFTPESWSEFEAVLNQAKAVDENGSATQSEVDAARSALLNAQAGLKELGSDSKADHIAGSNSSKDAVRAAASTKTSAASQAGLFGAAFAAAAAGLAALLKRRNKK